MPIYEYQAKNVDKACEKCREPFEVTQRLSDPPLKTCPECGAPLIKLISAPSIGASKSGFDDRAKAAGFSKLQKVSKGEYERKY